MDEEDDDVYAEQLKEVYKSCDLDSKGYINRNELIDLSQKLQLGDQVGELLKEILGDEDSDGKVCLMYFFKYYYYIRFLLIQFLLFQQICIVYIYQIFLCPPFYTKEQLVESIAGLWEL